VGERQWFSRAGRDRYYTAWRRLRVRAALKRGLRER
jgi:hypothetical protein